MNKKSKPILSNSEIQAQISALLYTANSRYGAYRNVHPTIDEQRMMYEKISELRKQLK